MRSEQRGYIDLGPAWMWTAAGWLMAIGALTIASGILFGIYWIITNVRFT